MLKNNDFITNMMKLLFKKKILKYLQLNEILVYKMLFLLLPM